MGGAVGRSVGEAGGPPSDDDGDGGGPRKLKLQLMPSHPSYTRSTYRAASVFLATPDDVYIGKLQSVKRGCS